MSKQSYRRLILAVFLPLLPCAVAAAWYAQQSTQQQGRNQFLQSAISESEQRLGNVKDLEKLKSDLLARYEVHQHLNSAVYHGPVQFLGEVSRRVPDEVSLHEMQLQGEDLVLSGRSRSVDQIEAFHKGLITSPFFGRPDQNALSTQRADGFVTFTMTLKAPRTRVRPGER